MLQDFWKKVRWAVRIFREDLDDLLYDSLTGLHQRQLLQELWQEQAEIADRYEEELSLGLIDIDGLKEVNDQQGHLAGDQALKRVASSMRKYTREADLLFRWGGDKKFLYSVSFTIK